MPVKRNATGLATNYSTNAMSFNTQVRASRGSFVLRGMAVDELSRFPFQTIQILTASQYVNNHSIT